MTAVAGHNDLLTLKKHANQMNDLSSQGDTQSMKHTSAGVLDLDKTLEHTQASHMNPA